MSDLLRQAQEKLKRLQAESRARRIEMGLPVDLAQKRKRPPVAPSTTATQSMPTHLGWERERFSEIARRPQQAPERRSMADWLAPLESQITSTADSPIKPKATQTAVVSAPTVPTLSEPKATQTAVAPVSSFSESQGTPTQTANSPVKPKVTRTAVATRPNHITLWPAIAIGMLKQELVAPGRVWLLLRWADTSGRGWFTVKEAQALLTDKASPHRLCGKPNFRRLLRQGAGVFWRRDKKRIWLSNTSRVGHALGVIRVQGERVKLPVSVLTSGMGQVRSHFYASFHSGRQQEGTQKPIARITIHKVCGVPASTQRLYERRCRVVVESNFAVGARETDAICF